MENLEIELRPPKRSSKMGLFRQYSPRQILASSASGAGGVGSTNLSVPGNSQIKISDFCAMDDERMTAARKHQKAADLRRLSDGTYLVKKEHHLLHRIVEGQLFEGASATAILLNSIFVGIQVDYGATNLTTETPEIFAILQMFFFSFFFLELSMRVAVEGRRLFWGPGWAWAYLDVFIVTTSIFEVIMDLVYASANKEEKNHSSNVRIVRTLRIARLLRIIRIARLLRFFHALRTFVFSIMATMQSLIWALVLLLLITYVFGIVLAQVASDYLIDRQLEGQLDDSATLTYYWGTLPRSMFTLYKTISNGLDWDTCVYPLHFLGWPMVVVFTVYISFTCFAVINVVTGIFCVSAIETAQRNEDLMLQQQILNKEFDIARLQRLFAQMDHDESGVITIGEFEEHFYEPNVQAVFDALQISAADAWTLWNILDSDHVNELKMVDFVGGLMRLKGNARRADFIEMQALQKRMLLLLQQMTKVVCERSQGAEARRSRTVSKDSRISPEASDILKVLARRNSE